MKRRKDRRNASARERKLRESDGGIIMRLKFMFRIHDHKHRWHCLKRKKKKYKCSVRHRHSALSKIISSKQMGPRAAQLSVLHRSLKNTRRVRHGTAISSVSLVLVFAASVHSTVKYQCGVVIVNRQPTSIQKHAVSHTEINPRNNKSPKSCIRERITFSAVVCIYHQKRQTLISYCRSTLYE